MNADTQTKLLAASAGLLAGLLWILVVLVCLSTSASAAIKTGDQYGRYRPEIHVSPKTGRVWWRVWEPAGDPNGNWIPSEWGPACNYDDLPDPQWIGYAPILETYYGRHVRVSYSCRPNVGFEQLTYVPFVGPMWLGIPRGTGRVQR